MPWRVALVLALAGAGAVRAQAPSNHEDDGRTLIVLAAPPFADPYYRPVRRDILDFQVAYARQILGRDNVVILCDRRTRRELAKEIPDDILLEAPMRDIWTRDFLPVRPDHPVLFRYAAAAQSGKQADADWVQAGFLRFAKCHGLAFRRAPWILDGGNVVDNGADKAIVTDRFLADNGLGREEAITLLREQLEVEQVAILPADPEDALGHADGMAAFIASNTVAITRGDGGAHETILRELREAFPGVGIVEIETEYDGEAFDPRYGSARGIHVNAIVTDRYLYLPVFGMATDAPALTAIRAASDREVVAVDASKVARLGGSVRCLGAQMKGDNARRLIEAARR
jgi:agmatine/peptidylarginine deiminase